MIWWQCIELDYWNCGTQQLDIMSISLIIVKGLELMETLIKCAIDYGKIVANQMLLLMMT